MFSSPCGSCPATGRRGRARGFRPDAVALHIWQMHGLAEMHFFFTAFTAMVAYEDGLAM